MGGREQSLAWFCYMIPDLYQCHRQGVRSPHHPLRGRAGHTMFYFPAHTATRPRAFQPAPTVAGSSRMIRCWAEVHDHVPTKCNNETVGLRAICHYQGLVSQFCVCKNRTVGLQYIPGILRNVPMPKHVSTRSKWNNRKLFPYVSERANKCDHWFPTGSTAWSAYCTSK